MLFRSGSETEVLCFQLWEQQVLPTVEPQVYAAPERVTLCLGSKSVHEDLLEFHCLKYKVGLTKNQATRQAEPYHTVCVSFKPSYLAQLQQKAKAVGNSGVGGWSAFWQEHIPFIVQHGLDLAVYRESVLLNLAESADHLVESSWEQLTWRVLTPDHIMLPLPL